MRFIIKHEIKGRIRVHAVQRKMTMQEADILCYYLEQTPGVTKVKVYEQTGDATVEYQGGREEILDRFRSFSYDVSVPDSVLESSGRALNAEYKEKLIYSVTRRAVMKWLVPCSITNVITTVKSVKYLAAGIRCLAKGKLEVPVLDATAIGVSVLRRDFGTAGSVMFLLGIGEILEEWTHKKSVGDLVRSMSLNITKVWLKTEDGKEVLVDAETIRQGDQIVVHMGNQIPFDGVVVSGEAMVNQASLTGEPLPVQKNAEKYVYAGTVLEEGELVICVAAQSGATRYEKIVTMIEESEKMKSAIESKASHLADRLVPYTFLGTGLVWLFTRNVTKTLSVLMVDFSCALNLAMPVTVLSAMRESSDHHITVKGGKYLEALSEAKTIVFDKTGTLTKAQPVFREAIPFGGKDEEEMLRIAACLEEHFPHSMAKAVVQAAKDRNLTHEEMHSKVDYIVAHGIASHIGEKKVVLGSYHFVFEDEQCVLPENEQERFDQISAECSRLYLAIDHQLAAVLCIEDPIRPEAAEAIQKLHEAGFEKIVMMTGDSEHTARAVAREVGVDAYYSEVLPEDKAAFVQKEKEAGNKVVMIGDGINDSPALSASDVGIAISDGAEIAREIADITIAADDLMELVQLKKLSNAMMKRINRNYRLIVGINGSLIGLGVAGVIQPATSALLHNTSTLMIGLESMRNLLPEE